MTTITENITSKKEKFLSNFSTQDWVKKNDYIHQLALEAQDALSEMSFPTSKTEAWKYTRVGKLIQQKFSESTQSKDIKIGNYHIPGINAIELVFVDGVFRKDLSQTIDDDTIIVMPLSEAATKHSRTIEKYYGNLTKEQDIFCVLNTAFPSDGFFVHVKKTFMDKAIHIIHVNRSDASYALSRNLVIAERSSQAQIITSYHTENDSPVFCNQLTEVFVKENARLTLDKIQQGGDTNFHISNDFAVQENDSTFHVNTYTLSGNWTRNNVAIRSRGKATTTDLYGLYHPRNKQHVDNHTLVEHGSTDGVSNELYKGLIYDQAQGVFNGKVIVEPHAQRTNAYQQNANILMSDDANVNSKPELEIYADDVKCSHGSTTGQFDEEALFYLMARGIHRTRAKKLLTEAFLSDVIEHCEIAAVREWIGRELADS